MPFFGPNIRKLAAADDVDGLRAALHHPWRYIRVDAAKSLGELALPSDATERRDNVPQEVVAELLDVARSLLSERETRTTVGFGIRGAMRQEWQRLTGERGVWEEVADVVGAIASIGGPAGTQAMLELSDEWQAGRSRLPGLLALLGVDALIPILEEGTRPRWLRDLVFMALEERSSNRTPEDEERAAAAARAYRAERIREFESAADISADTAVALLTWLYDASPRGEGFLVGERPAERVRMVGQRLWETGGFAMMLEAHRLFAEQRPRAARNLEMVWDGIGTWQG